jgi:hypothetical protein
MLLEGQLFILNRKQNYYHLIQKTELLSFITENRIIII